MASLKVTAKRGMNAIFALGIISFFVFVGVVLIGWRGSELEGLLAAVVGLFLLFTICVTMNYVCFGRVTIWNTVNSDH